MMLTLLGLFVLAIMLFTNIVQRADDAINTRFNLDPRTFAIAFIVAGILFWLFGYIPG
jgi:hypothetical protein